MPHDAATSCMCMASSHALLFFKRFLASPATIGAIAPTSNRTAYIMCAPVNAHGRVLEIGAGTGAITQALVRHLTDPSRLTSVEMDPVLAAQLKKNLPQLHLLVDDAENILRDGQGWDAIVSGIPFVAMERHKRARMFELIGRKLNTGGVFVAFQYSLSTKKELEKLFRTVEIKLSPLNIPPAFIYVCRM
jgi:phospholipid N-methyltransferase